MADELADDLCARLASVLGATTVGDLVHLSGGASRDTWRFVADGRPLILQRQRPGDTRDMDVEANVMRVAALEGVPVAEVVAASVDGTLLGEPFIVLALVEGETIARKILRDDDFERAREVLPTQLGRALTQIHATDISAVRGLPAHDQLQQYRNVLDQLAQPHPTFELVFRWLEAHRPPVGRLCLVHGDFRMGNLIVGPDGLRAVLDWELAHLGDPMEDLGWLCVRAWRFGSPLPAAGVGTYQQLFDAYAHASGSTVDPDIVRWWEVLGTLKWGIMCITQAHSHVAGVARSHELAAIGRRVCENEHDLFLALEGRW